MFSRCTLEGYWRVHLKMENVDEVVPDNAWMIRPCEMYKEEYKDCDSIKGRFHQYFIYGAVQDCKQWRKDFDNCMKWRTKQNHQAIVSVIESEKQRKVDRLEGMLTNDIWKLRKTKMNDSEWNKPLPEYITRDHPNSYLQAMKIQSKSGSQDERQACIIL